MTHRGPFQPLTFCDSVLGSPTRVLLRAEHGSVQTGAGYDPEVQLMAEPVFLGEAGGGQRASGHSGRSCRAESHFHPPCSRDLYNSSHLCPETVVNLRYQEC